MMNKQNTEITVTSSSDLGKIVKGVTKITASFAQLEELPELHEGLEELNCEGNLLTKLPPLPSSLKILRCGYNKLEELPELPKGLEELNCEGNLLTKLPTLPSNLKILRCGYNKLKKLPDLPMYLIELYCEVNLIIELPKLNSKLKNLNCSFNKISIIDLKDNKESLEFICYHYNPLILPVYLGVKNENNETEWNSVLHSKFRTYEHIKYLIDRFGEQHFADKIIPSHKFGYYCFMNDVREYAEFKKDPIDIKIFTEGYGF